MSDSTKTVKIDLCNYDTQRLARVLTQVFNPDSKEIYIAVYHMCIPEDHIKKHDEIHKEMVNEYIKNGMSEEDAWDKENNMSCDECLHDETSGCSFFKQNSEYSSDKYEKGFYEHYFKLILPKYEVTNMWLYMQAIKILGSDIDLGNHNSLSSIYLANKSHKDIPVYVLSMDS